MQTRPTGGGSSTRGLHSRGLATLSELATDARSDDGLLRYQPQKCHRESSFRSGIFIDPPRRHYPLEVFGVGYLGDRHLPVNGDDLLLDLLGQVIRVLVWGSKSLIRRLCG